MPYFVFNGVDSRSMGVRLAVYPPLFRAPERVDSVTVPGRPGTLHLLEGADIRETVVKTFKISNQRGADMQAILRWLSGPGVISFGNEPDYAYEGRFIQAIQADKLYNGVWIMNCQFEAQPFRRLVVEPPALTLTNGGTIYNPGDIAARPVLTVTGTGALELTIGDQTFSVANIQGSTGYIIDLAAEMLVSSDGEQQLTQYSTGDWMTIQPGTSEVSWTGSGITSITMTQPWRWR